MVAVMVAETAVVSVVEMVAAMFVVLVSIQEWLGVMMEPRM